MHFETLYRDGCEFLFSLGIRLQIEKNKLILYLVYDFSRLIHTLRRAVNSATVLVLSVASYYETTLYDNG